MKKTQIYIALFALAAVPSFATEPWTADDFARPFGAPVPPRVGYSLPAPAYDADAVFARGCAFVASWQVTDPNSPDYGGIIEGEDMTNIIQSDNTQESIWDWSRYRELTGSHQYDEYTARSWIYVYNFPAWLEEDWQYEAYKYYRIYNCGWGMRAEMMYRRATGDQSHKDYGMTCAHFVIDNPIDIETYLVNGLCTAWAVGNLYAYAVDVGDADLKAGAVALAEKIKTWAEADPGMRIGYYSWAMSGGATVWGLHESYFKEHPGEEAAWMAQYAPYLKDLVAPSENTWDNAWNAWFMLGHYCAYHAGGDAAYWNKFDYIAGNLVAQDTDGDGGIPPSQGLDDTHDHTWVTSYMCFMGMDPIVRDLSVADFKAEPRPGEIVVSWTSTFEYPADGYNLYREVTGFPGRPKINDEPLGGSPPYEFTDPHIIPGREYKYWVEALSPTGHTRVAGPAKATAGGFPLSFALAQNYPNPTAGRTTVEFALPKQEEATLRIYDLAGREVWRRDEKCYAGKHVWTLDLRLAPGVYVYRLEAGEDAAARRMVVAP